TVGAGNASSSWGGDIRGDIALVKVGTGTFTLNAVNHFNGGGKPNGLTIQAGTIGLGTDNSIPSGFNVQIHADATPDLQGHDCTLGSHSGAGTIIYDPLPVFATLTTGGDNLSTTFSGIISGNIALVKVGTGTLTLSGANTYVGPTTVLEGTLQVTGSL